MKVRTRQELQTRVVSLATTEGIRTVIALYRERSPSSSGERSPTLAAADVFTSGSVAPTRRQARTPSPAFASPRCAASRRAASSTTGTTIPAPGPS